MDEREAILAVVIRVVLGTDLERGRRAAGHAHA